MTKSHLIKLVDLFSFIGLVAMISTGALLYYTLPPRSGPATVWGMTRHEWGDIHFFVALVFLVLMSLHLFLHVRFIKRAIMGRASREHNYRLAIGVFGLCILLVLAFAPVVSPVENQTERGMGKHRQLRE